MHLLLGEIYWLNVGYQDSPTESKIRPVVIIGIEDDELLLLVATTSVPSKDPPKHFDKYKIPILNWRKAGLLKPSWVQGLRLILDIGLRNQSFFWKRPLTRGLFSFPPKNPLSPSP